MEREDEFITVSRTPLLPARVTLDVLVLLDLTCGESSNVANMIFHEMRIVILIVNLRTGLLSLSLKLS